MNSAPRLVRRRSPKRWAMVFALLLTFAAPSVGWAHDDHGTASTPANPWGWLILYGLIVVAASLVGGWIPGHVRLTHRRIQHIISFVAGLMLGIALLHLLPHALAHGDDLSAESAGGWMLAGILLMFILLRAFHFHVHEPDTLIAESDTEPSPLGVDHECSSPGHGHHDHSAPGAGFGWAGVFFGLAVHTLIDGVALGAAMTAELGHNTAAFLPGVGILAAIALHKPLDAMSITSLMAVDGWSKKAQNLANMVFALLCPLGAALFFAGTLVGNETLVPVALAVSAGVFLCIALSDLLPEMEFHSHDRVTLSIALAAGIGLAVLIGFLEPDSLHG